MSEKVDAAVLEFTVKGEQAVSTFGRIEDAAEKMETAAKRSADRTADSIAGIGKGAAAHASAMEAGSRRFIAALEQEANRVSLTRAEYKRWQAESRGIARDVYEPLIAKIEQAEAAQRSLSRTTTQSAEKLGGAFGGAVASVGALQAVLGGFGILSFARGFVQAADSVTVLNNQLKLATGSTATAATAYEALFGIAQRSRTSFTELGGTYASIARATDSLGISQGRLLNVTEAIGNALAISGGSADGMRAALVQLGQGLASGTLRGDELNSVLEQTPRLARAIADGMGVSVGKLRELGQEGKITAETIIKALESQSAVLAAEVQNSTVTVGQAWTQLANSVTRASGELDKATKTTGTIAGAMQSLSSKVDDVADRFARAREAGYGFFGSLAVAQVIAAAEALGHVDAGAANVGRRLGEAEKELTRLQERFAQRGGFYLATEVEKAEELVKKLREAKQAQDDLKAERGTSQSAQFGQASSAIDALAKKGLEDQSKAATLLADARNKALKVDDAWLKTLMALNAEREKGFIKDTEYIPLVQKLTAETYKAHKSTADAFVAERDAAKDWARVWIEANKIADDASAKQGNLTKAQAALIEYLKSPAYSINSEAMRQLAVNALIAAHNVEELGESQKRTAAIMAEANGHYSKFIADLQRSGDSVEAQIAAMQDQARAAEISAAQHISLSEAIQMVTIARLREKAAAMDIPDAAAYNAIQREIEARERLLGTMRSKAAKDANAEAARQQAEVWTRLANDVSQTLTDALFEGGKDAGDQLEAYFKRLILRPIVEAAVQPFVNTVLQMVGGGGGSTGAGASGANSWLSLVGTAGQAGGGWGNIASTVGGWVGLGGGAAAGGTAIAGSSYGAAVNAALAEYGITSGASAGAGAGAAAGSSAASAIPIIGWIIAAIMASKAAYEGGNTLDMLRDVKGYGVGKFEADKYDTLQFLGVSEKWSQILSGAPLTARLFGHKGSVSGFGIGSVNNGDFVQSNTKPFEFGRNVLGGGVDEGLQELAARLAGSVTLSASLFGGGLTNGLRVGALTDRDRENEVAALLGFFNSDNKLIAGTQTGSGAFGAGGPGTAASKIAAGDFEKWVSEQMPVLLIQGLQQSNLDARFAEYFKSVAPADLDAELANKMLQTATAVAQLTDSFAPLGGALAQFSTLSVTSFEKLATASGGFDALGQNLQTYYNAFYTEAERTEDAWAGITKVLNGVGITTIPKTRDEFRALVDSLGDLSTTADQQAFAALTKVAGAFDHLITAADATAAAAEEAAKKLAGVLVESVSRFGTPQERQASTFGGIATGLQRDAGVSVSIGQLIGASIADIEAFARGFISVSTNSDAAKTALLGAANALFDLKTKATDKSGSLEIGLLRAQGHELEAVNLERKAEIAQLAALEASLGATAGTFTTLQQQIYAANDAAAAMARNQSVVSGVDAVAADFLSGSELTGYLSGRIKDILAGGGIDASTATILGSTRDQVKELFLAVGIDGKEAILQALPLWEQMQDAIHGTSDTIGSFVKDLQRFSGSLKFGDLSPLSAEAQLTAAQSLYESTLAKAKAGDQDARGAFTGVAQAYLQEAQGAFASGKAYTDIFNRVLGDSDALALALSGGTSAITTALTKSSTGSTGSTAGTALTSEGSGSGKSATGTGAQQILSASIDVFDIKAYKLLDHIEMWNRLLVGEVGESGPIVAMLKDIDAKMSNPAAHADAMASALTSAPPDRTFIEGPAGSSGGLSGAKAGQYIEPSQSLGMDRGGNQAALLERVEVKLSEVVKRLDAIAVSNDANASIAQQAIKANSEDLKSLKEPLNSLASTAKQAHAKAAVMPPPKR